jgi:hypothetical protein
MFWMEKMTRQSLPSTVRLILIAKPATVDALQF